MAREDIEQKQIVLDLRPGYEGGAGVAEGFIQVEARSRLVDLLEAAPRSSVEARGGARPQSLNVMDDRTHDAVFINARRGAGKTTFLLKVLKELETRRGTTGVSLYPLGIIDPTLIETKQHVVVVVIDRIRAAVSYGRAQSPSLPDVEYDAYKQSLRRLARGLTMLDGIGSDGSHSQQWADPEYVLEKGLEDARAGFGFEREFRTFVEHACRYLGIDSFILAVDDVDTWFERGWPVVEALRKYLTSPRLQVVLSGDMELYGLLLRSSQWKQMGREFLEAEQWQDDRAGGRSRMAAITDKVDELQDQYLIKVLKPERRIDLKPLIAVRGRLRFRTSQDTSGFDVEQFGKRFGVNLLAVRSASDQRQIMDLLLRLPTRSALQIMIACHDLLSRRRAASLSSARAHALDALRHVAWTELNKLGLSPSETLAMPPALLPNLLAKWFTDGNLWRSMPRLHPDAIDTNIGLPALFGAALAVDAFRADPAQMPIYWLKISVVREMLDAGLVSEEDGPRGVRSLVKHLNLYAVESSLQTVGRLAAFELEAGRRVQPGIYFSVASVPLDRVRERPTAAFDLYGRTYRVGRGGAGASLIEMVGLHEDIDRNVPKPLQAFHHKLKAADWKFKGRGGGFNGGFANGISELASKVSPAAALVVRAPAVEIISGQRKVQGGYSVLRLIALFAALLEVVGQEDDDEALALRVRHVLTDAALLRSYPTPSAAADDDETTTPRSPRGSKSQPETWEDDDESEVDVEPDQHNDENELVEAVVEWIKVWRGEIPPLAPVVLSRIWARYTYAHRSVRDKLRHLESRFLGTFVFRSLIAFFHAVLIESVRAHDVRASSSANTNPVTSPEPFVSLLEDVDFDAALPAWDDSGLKFFDALFTFPVWAFFLPRKADIVWRREPEANAKIFALYEERRANHELRPVAEFAHVRYRPDGGSEAIEFEGLYDLLNTVHMQGNPKQRPTKDDPLTDPNDGL